MPLRMGQGPPDHAGTLGGPPASFQAQVVLSRGAGTCPPRPPRKCFPTLCYLRESRWRPSVEGLGTLLERGCKSADSENA